MFQFLEYFGFLFSIKFLVFTLIIIGTIAFIRYIQNDEKSHGHGHNHDHGCNHIFREELLHHLPYAIFSVALGMIILSFVDYSSAIAFKPERESICQGYGMLFHSFHFLHILFAATGTIITFSRFSNSLSKALLVGTICPAFFCILSDIVLPNLAGRLLGVNMDLHICLHRELHNILPFLFVGILNGLVLRTHHTSMLKVFSISSHFIHILISSLASLFYMVSHGFVHWYAQMGYVFFALVIAIVIPCTLSDVVVPMYFAGVKKDEKHTS